MPFRTNDTALLKLYEAFLGAQRLLDLPPVVFDEAARLRAMHQSLKTPDAIHLAAARYHGCVELWTNDGRLNAVVPGMARKVT
jgi:predicted nucleic acid-binding protein